MSDHISIQLNGRPYRVQSGQTLQDLIDLLGYRSKRIAVEHNRTIVPRSRFDHCTLQAGDRIEIVQAIGGG